MQLDGRVRGRSRTAEGVTRDGTHTLSSLCWKERRMALSLSLWPLFTWINNWCLQLKCQSRSHIQHLFIVFHIINNVSLVPPCLSEQTWGFSFIINKQLFNLSHWHDSHGCGEGFHVFREINFIYSAETESNDGNLFLFSNYFVCCVWNALGV